MSATAPLGDTWHCLQAGVCVRKRSCLWLSGLQDNLAARPGLQGDAGVSTVSPTTPQQCQGFETWISVCFGHQPTLSTAELQLVLLNSFPSVNFIQNRHDEKVPPSDWPLGHFLDNWCGRAQFMWAASPWAGGLGAIINHNEYITSRQPVSSLLHGLCFSACLQVPALRSYLNVQFTPAGLWPGHVHQIKPFSPKLVLCLWQQQKVNHGRDIQR